MYQPGWIRCTCLCGIAGAKEYHMSLPPNATIGQIRIVLLQSFKATESDLDPDVFNKIIVNGNVYDFMQRDLCVLPFHEEDRNQQTETGLLIQLIRDKDHPDLVQ